MNTDERPRRRGPWLAVATLIAVVIVSTVGIGGWAYLNLRTETTQAVIREPVQVLDVASGSSRVTVRQGTAGQVRIRQQLSWSLKKPPVERMLSGGVLRVQASCVEKPTVSMGCLVDLDFTVPLGTEIHIRSTSGSTTVQDIEGDLNLNSVSGEIHLEGVRGHIFARTDFGPVDGELDAQTVDVGSRSGSVDLDFVRPPKQVLTDVREGHCMIWLPALVAGARHDATGNPGREPESEPIQDGAAEEASPNMIHAMPGSQPCEIHVRL